MIVFQHFIALDNVRVFESHFAARSQPKIFRWRCFHKIIAVDEKLAAEWNFACPGICIFRIIDGIQLFDPTFRIIGQHNFYWPQHSEPAAGGAIEFIAHRVLKQGHVGHARVFRDTNVVSERAQRTRCHPAPAQTGNREHARVVPAVHEFVVHELNEFSFAHNRVSQI